MEPFVSRCHSATNNDDYFPRFSRQRCGGSNRNGTLFKTYSNVRADLSSRDIPLPLCLCVKLCLCRATACLTTSLALRTAAVYMPSCLYA